MWPHGAIGTDGKWKKEELTISFFVSHRFALSSTESSSGAEPVIHYTGLSTEAVASALKPFTQYTATLEVSPQPTVSFQSLCASGHIYLKCRKMIPSVKMHVLSIFVSPRWWKKIFPTGVFFRGLLVHGAAVFPHSLGPPTEPASTQSRCSRTSYAARLLGAARPAQRYQPTHTHVLQ